MKKFVFTLASVLKFKQTVEKKQKAELAIVNALLQKLYTQDAQLDADFVRTSKSLQRALEEQIDVPAELARHDAYFTLIRENKKALAEKIALAEAEKKRRQDALIATMNEIKTLENLKEEQLEQYMEEVRAEEAKDMGDLISYRTIVKDPD